MIHLALALLVALQIADVLTTIPALAIGASEMNPLGAFLYGRLGHIAWPIVKMPGLLTMPLLAFAYGKLASPGRRFLLRCLAVSTGATLGVITMNALGLFFYIALVSA